MTHLVLLLITVSKVYNAEQNEKATRVSNIASDFMNFSLRVGIQMMGDMLRQRCVRS